MNKKPSILIVEDETYIAMALELDLEKAGYHVQNKVATGEDAIKTVIDKKPDIILMDIRLAGKMDGITTALKIKKIDDIPIVFMSGFSDTLVFERMKECDPVACLTKPVAVETVIKVLNAVAI